MLQVFEHGGTHAKWILLFVLDSVAYWIVNYLTRGKTVIDDLIGIPLVGSFFCFLTLTLFLGWAVEIGLQLLRDLKELLKRRRDPHGSE
jgi:uncharacterized membrane protein YhdT